MSPKVTKVEPLENFTLRLFFSNGEVKRFDVTPYLEQGIFVELKDIHYFNRVKPFFGGVQWLHEQDFSADTLYLESQADIDWQAMQQAV
jgi:Protein of unknown function (DUF2442)